MKRKEKKKREDSGTETTSAIKNKKRKITEGKLKEV